MSVWVPVGVEVDPERLATVTSALLALCSFAVAALLFALQRGLAAIPMVGLSTDLRPWMLVSTGGGVVFLLVAAGLLAWSGAE